tara:strand:- start:221 stop:373 length:153 start_codon:yes stop_codon:yes gene_type:complete
MAKNKKKKKRRRNPYHQVMRELFRPKTIPDKRKKKNKNKCRKPIKQGEAE